MHQFFTDGERLALVQKDGRRGGVFTKIVCRHTQNIHIALLQHEAVFRVFDRRGDERRARHRAVFRTRHLKTRHRARHRDGEVTSRARAFDHVAVFVQIHIGRRCERGLLAEVQENLTPVGKLHGHEAAAAQIARRRIHDREGVAHGNGRVHRVAAVFKHVHADLRREVLGGDHHPVFCGDGRD